MTPEEQEEAVRRALAAEPDPGPLPGDVAARLDAALADLVAERSEAPSAGAQHEAPVVGPRSPTAARSRRGRGLLVAAASVAVLGVGVGTVLQNQGFGGDSESATSGALDTTDGASEESAPQLAEGEPGTTSLDRSFVPTPSPVRLRTETLRADVARVDGARTVAAESAPEGVRPDEPAAPGDRTAARLLSACDLPFAGPGDRLIAVLLDGERGTLVLRDTSGEAVVAQVYACDDGDVLLAETRLTDR